MGGNKSAILTYHSIDCSGSPISIPPHALRMHLDVLAGAGVRVAPLAEAAVVPGSVALTFDDGFRNFLDHALPMLEARHLPATVFVVSAHCGKHNDWPSQPAGIERRPLMDWADLRDLAKRGIVIGGHSVSHPDLTILDDAALRSELADCRARIEDRAGVAVEAFAYPYGLSDARVRSAAAAHYRLAVGTTLRFTGRGDDPFDLPRIDAYYLRHEWVVRRLFERGGGAYVRARGVLRSVRSALRG